jgi:hypothetical protein
MADLFIAATPAEGDAVKNGASNIRTLKTSLNTLLSFLFTDTVGTRAASGVTTTMVADKAVTVAKINNGTANQVLRTNSGGTAAEWGAVPAAAVTGIVNSQIDAAAAISVSKLAAGGTRNFITMYGGVPVWNPAVSASGTITISYGTVHTYVHGAGYVPAFVEWYLVNLVTELGYAVGTEVCLPAGVFNSGSNNPRTPTAYQDTTNANLFLDSGLTLKLPIQTAGGTFGDLTAIDIATPKWALRCRVSVF